MKLGIDLGGVATAVSKLPFLNAASTGGGVTAISGNLRGSRPDSAYQIQIFASNTPDASGFGEGEIFLGTLQVQTDDAGTRSSAARFRPRLRRGHTSVPPRPMRRAIPRSCAQRPCTKGTADLSVALLASAASVQVGETVTFTLVVTNNGSTVARGVTATSLLPAGATLVSVTSDDGIAIPGPNSLSFYFGGFEVGESAVATIVLRTSATSGNSLTSSASVASLEGDPNPANNIATAMVAVDARVDLTVDIRSPKCRSSRSESDLRRHREKPWPVAGHGGEAD